MKDVGASSFDRNRIYAEQVQLDSCVEYLCGEGMELDLIVSGKGSYSVNGATVPCEEGMISCFRGICGWRLFPEGTMKLLRLCFDPRQMSKAVFDKLEALADHTNARPDDETALTIKELLGLLVRECEQNGAMSSASYMVCLAEGVLIKFLNAAAFSTGGVLSDTVRQAVAYIRMHLTEELSLNAVAEAVHYHPKHFCAMFRKEMKMTYTEYVAKLKIEYAKTLLSTTTFNMERICASCGFASMTYFRRVFKRYCGMTPLKYRTYVRSNRSEGKRL